MPSERWIRRDLDGEAITRMYLEEKKSSNQIAKELSTSHQTINRLLRDLGVSRRNGSESNLVSWGNRKYLDVVIEERQDQILVGTLLGDGHVGIQASSINPSFSVGHREQDKDYLFWKYEELKTTGLFKSPPFPRQKPINGKIFTRWVIRSIQHPVLKEYLNLMYTENRNIITLRTLERMGLLGLSIYYQDDGGFHNRRPHLYTYGYNEDEIRLLKYFLDSRWDLKFELKPVKYGRPKKEGFILVLERASIPRFKELIVPYILPCMSRKIPP